MFQGLILLLYVLINLSVYGISLYVFDPKKGEVSHDISGDVTLLVENFSGSLYEVTSPTGTVNRFDHRRVEIHDFGTDSTNQLLFGGFLENPDATMKFHLCPGN